MIVLWQEVAKMDDIWLKIKELAAAGNGIVSTKQVEHRHNGDELPPGRSDPPV